MLTAPLASEILTPHIVRYRAQNDHISQCWIIDRTTADSLCDAVDHALGQSSEDYRMAFGTPSFRYVNVFLWPAGTSPLWPLYRLNTIVMLQYISRTSFEWTVHYASVRDYDQAQSAIAGFLQSSVTQVCPPSPPPALSYNAESLLDQLIVFEGTDVDMTAGNTEGGEEFSADFFDALEDLAEKTPKVVNEDVGMMECAAPILPPIPTSPTVCDPSSPAIETDAIAGWDQIERLFAQHPLLDLIDGTEVQRQSEMDPVPLSSNIDTAMNVPQPSAAPLSRSSPSPFHHFPLSEFTRHKRLSQQDVKSANCILTKFKILAIAHDFRATARGRRYSLDGEKQAIMSMPLDTSLSINSTRDEHLGVPEILRRACSRYDAERNGKPLSVGLGVARWPGGRPRSAEKVERGLLLIAILLLRHSCMYVEPQRDEESGKRTPGQHFAVDFDRRIPQTTLNRRQGTQPIGLRQPANCNVVVRRARTLCRIVVACGHPCIVVILVRLSIRLSVRLVDLLDELPLDALCNWLATGSVTSSRLHVSARALVSGTSSRGERLEWDLRWLHENVLLPLLAVASRRMPDRFSMLDGRVECTADACLAAIVPHSLQTRYLGFLQGQYRHDEWTSGRVQLSTSAQDVVFTGNGTPTRCSSVVSTPRTVVNEDGDWDQPGAPSRPQYSIATANRTFARTNVAAYADNGQLFDPPPAFLVNQILDLVEDV